MSELQERLWRLGRLGWDPVRPSVDRLERRVRQRRRRRHVATATVSMVLLAVAGIGVVSVVDDEPAAVVTGTTLTGPDGSDRASDEVSRPVLAEEVCQAQSADELSRQADVLFVYRLTDDVAVQAVAIDGDPGEGFALVVRAHDGQRASVFESRSGHDSFRGRRASVSLFDDGAAEAWIEVAGGSHLYVRAHGLDEPTFRSLLGALRPRPADADVPGADVAPNDAGWRIVDEGVGPFELHVASSRCRLDASNETTVSVVSGSPVAVYAAALDRPDPALHRFQSDSVLTVNGAERIDGELVLDHVVQADAETWRRLRRR